MHYIRFLKVPRVLQQGRDQKTLSAKITITTDLGESFLGADVGVEVFLSDLSGTIIPGSKPISYSWLGRNGMRALEISIATPKSHRGGLKMCIHPKDARYSVESFNSIFTSSSSLLGGIVAVHSTTINLDSNTATEALAERQFKTPMGGIISIWEETGESIARHIWYAFSRYVFLPLLLTSNS